MGIPPLEPWQIFPPGTVFCSQVAVISGAGRALVRAGRCWGTRSPFPGLWSAGHGRSAGPPPVLAQGSRPWSLPHLCDSPSTAVLQLWGSCTTWRVRTSVRAETVSWERPAAQNEVLPQAANGNSPLIFLVLLVDFFKAGLCQSITLHALN